MHLTPLRVLMLVGVFLLAVVPLGMISADEPADQHGTSATAVPRALTPVW